MVEKMAREVRPGFEPCGTFHWVAVGKILSFSDSVSYLSSGKDERLCLTGCPYRPEG